MTRARDLSNLIGSGNYVSETLTATAGQTAFTVTNGYTPNFVQVFMNGLLLDPVVDYAATTSPTITLTTAANAGDELEVVKYNTFSVGDAITQTAADTRYVNASGDTMTGTLDVQGTITADGLTVDGSSSIRHTDATTNISLTPTSTGGVVNVRDSSGNSQILLDARTTQVGIGTSSPAYKLDVASAVIQFGDSTDAFAQYKSSAGNWHVGANSSNAFAFYSGTYGSGTERMRIDSAGRVTMPYQPAFHAYIDGSNPSHTSAATKVPLNGTRFNIGNCWDTTNYRFTAPVEGNYVFHVNQNVYNLNAGEWWRTVWYVNGAMWQIGTYQVSQRAGDQTHQSSIVVRLSANDTFEYYSQSSSTYTMSAGVAWNSLMGYLIG